MFSCTGSNYTTHFRIIVHINNNAKQIIPPTMLQFMQHTRYFPIHLCQLTLSSLNCFSLLKGGEWRILIPHQNLFLPLLPSDAYHGPFVQSPDLFLNSIPKLIISSIRGARAANVVVTSLHVILTWLAFHNYGPLYPTAFWVHLHSKYHSNLRPQFNTYQGGAYMGGQLMLTMPETHH